MIVIVGGKPDVHGVTRHAKRKVGSMHSRKHYVCTNLFQIAVCVLCLCRSPRVKKDLCKVTGEKADVYESQGWRHRQGSVSMKRFTDLTLIPASQFVVRVSQLFAFPLLTLWCHSHLVRLVFEASIPCFPSENFL